jgi:hypothetical protein
VGSVELGHATDTTLSRSSAGVLAVEGNVVYAAGGTDVPVTDGGTGRSTSTTAYGLIAAGTTATGAHQTLAAGATTEILVGGGASALPAWTTATGSGAPVRATSPTLVTPALGTPSALTLTNATGLPVAGITASTSTALGVGSVELGHASDTTLARSAAGVVTVEGNALATVPYPFTTVAATGSTEAIDWNVEVHELTMDQNCTFSFSNLPADNVHKNIQVHIRGAFTPTLPASCDFAGTPATYASPTLYLMECYNGTDVLVTIKGAGYA